MTRIHDLTIDRSDLSNLCSHLFLKWWVQTIVGANKKIHYVFLSSNVVFSLEMLLLRNIISSI